MTPTQFRTAWGLVALASATLIATAACSTPEPEPKPTPTMSASPTPSTTPSPTQDPAEAQAEAEILDAYRGYWDGLVTSFAGPSQPQSPELAANSDDAALADAQSSLIQLQTSGIHLVGEPILTPEVTSVDLNAMTATLVDCVDASNWLPVFTDTGNSAAAPDQPTRLTYEATAFHPEDRWLLRTFTVHRDQPC